ncbi:MULTISPECIES: hypothetical protein [unclassified Nostoc]|uniref:hypothetical protein n=1 Tax=unclassified Nostoc TaxID=2593658 RepID=UPI002AD3ED94|nr:hypothetical protein [Nostoc sp. DedQUE03]MDZ7974801.1 hypothetical protein [Nostoc sp. DedQUE03]MDZ8045008.1 hypothetical protein [Nostoc sp. DedQUE02]
MAQSKKFAKSQQKHYLPTQGNNAPPLNLSNQKQSPKREPIKHLLIGSPKAVTSTIHLLQVLGYASVGDWSTLLPTGNPDEVMSILSRQILMQ